jgi:hypothetical protein
MGPWNLCSMRPATELSLAVLRDLVVAVSERGLNHVELDVRRPAHRLLPLASETVA